MSNNKKSKVCSDSCGIIWIIGWLFSIGFLDLPFWNAVLGIILWPYYIGHYLYQLQHTV